MVVIGVAPHFDLGNLRLGVVHYDSHHIRLNHGVTVTIVGHGAKFVPAFIQRHHGPVHRDQPGDGIFVRHAASSQHSPGRSAYSSVFQRYHCNGVSFDLHCHSAGITDPIAISIHLTISALGDCQVRIQHVFAIHVMYAGLRSVDVVEDHYGKYGIGIIYVAHVVLTHRPDVDVLILRLGSQLGEVHLPRNLPFPFGCWDSHHVAVLRSADGQPFDAAGRIGRILRLLQAVLKRDALQTYISVLPGVGLDDSVAVQVAVNVGDHFSGQDNILIRRIKLEAVSAVFHSHTSAAYRSLDNLGFGNSTVYCNHDLIGLSHLNVEGVIKRHCANVPIDVLVRRRRLPHSRPAITGVNVSSDAAEPIESEPLELRRENCLCTSHSILPCTSSVLCIASPGDLEDHRHSIHHVDPGSGNVVENGYHRHPGWVSGGTGLNSSVHLHVSVRINGRRGAVKDDGLADHVRVAHPVGSLDPHFVDAIRQGIQIDGGRPEFVVRSVRRRVVVHVVRRTGHPQLGDSRYVKEEVLPRYVRAQTSEPLQQPSVIVQTIEFGVELVYHQVLGIWYNPGVAHSVYHEVVEVGLTQFQIHVDPPDALASAVVAGGHGLPIAEVGIRRANWRTSTCGVVIINHPVVHPHVLATRNVVAVHVRPRRQIQQHGLLGDHECVGHLARCDLMIAMRGLSGYLPHFSGISHRDLSHDRVGLVNDRNGYTIALDIAVAGDVELQQLTGYLSQRSPHTSCGSRPALGQESRIGWEDGIAEVVQGQFFYIGKRNIQIGVQYASSDTTRLHRDDTIHDASGMLHVQSQTAHFDLGTHHVQNFDDDLAA